MRPATPPMRLAPRPKYVALARMAMQQAVAYRGALTLSLVANLTWGIILYYLWRTVFADQDQVGSFDWDRMRTYILLAYAVNSLLSFVPESRMVHTIRTGQVATDLMRPIDYQTSQLAQLVGAAAIEGLIGAALAVLLGLLLLDAAPPASALAAGLFILSVALGFFVKALLGYLVGLLCFWTQNAVGLIWARQAVTNVFSGALIPLALFPDWLQTAALASPFQATVHTPLTIYLGDTAGWALAGALAVQGAWIAALWLLARLLWLPSARVLTVQGG